MSKKELRDTLLAYLADPTGAKVSLTEEHLKILRGMHVRPSARAKWGWEVTRSEPTEPRKQTSSVDLSEPDKAT